MCLPACQPARAGVAWKQGKGKGKGNGIGGGQRRKKGSVMAEAASTSATATTSTSTSATTSQTAPPGRAASVSRPWAVAAAVLAVVYGLWAAEIGRGAGPITGYNVLLGVVAGVLFGAGFLAVHIFGRGLPREQHAAAWAAFAGVSLGFAYSLSGESVLRSTGVGLAAAVLVLAVTFYRFYTQED